MNFKITSGNADDRGAVEHLCSNLKSLLFGDRGYKSLIQNYTNKVYN
jgi:hypothetical protein